MIKFSFSLYGRPCQLCIYIPIDPMKCNKNIHSNVAIPYANWKHAHAPALGHTRYNTRYTCTTSNHKFPRPLCITKRTKGWFIMCIEPVLMEMIQVWLYDICLPAAFSFNANTGTIGFHAVPYSESEAIKQFKLLYIPVARKVRLRTSAWYRFYVEATIRKVILPDPSANNLSIWKSS